MQAKEQLFFRSPVLREGNLLMDILLTSLLSKTEISFFGFTQRFVNFIIRVLPEITIKTTSIHGI